MSKLAKINLEGLVYSIVPFGLAYYEQYFIALIYIGIHVMYQLSQIKDILERKNETK